MGSAVFQNGEASQSRIRNVSPFVRFITSSWWVLAFSLICSSFYYQKGRARDAAIVEVSYRLQEMEKELLIVGQKRDEMQLRLESQNDPAWIEMVLMRELGVVPEGWVKVHFTR